MEQSSNLFDDAPHLGPDGDIISVYTRAQALPGPERDGYRQRDGSCHEDGVLIDISDLARQAGFKYPVAVTCGLWAEVIEPDETSRAIGQSETGRIWDILMVLRFMLRNPAVSDSDIVPHLGPFGYFNPLFVFSGQKPIAKKLKAHCGPGDNGEPAITIMLPDED